MGLFSRLRKEPQHQARETRRPGTGSTGPPSLEDLRRNVSSGGLSYIMPPADLPGISPEAHKLAMQGAVGGMTGNDAASLEQFEEAFRIVRDVVHPPSEVRLLYNIGVAHHKLGNDDRAIETLLEGKALAELVNEELAREARKLQRAREELQLDAPGIQVLGTPDLDQQMLVMYLEALATVHEATGHQQQAAASRQEAEDIVRRGA